MITSADLIDGIRPHVNLNGEQAHISLTHLLELVPELNIDQIAMTLIALDGVTITDSKLGGINIPGRYFQ